MLQTARLIAIRIAGLSLLIGVFAGIAALFGSYAATRWIELVGFAAAMIAVAWWAHQDALVIDLNSSLRNWIVVSFLLSVVWWIALTLFEGERDVIERLSLDFWSVMVTIGLVFVAALFGTLSARDQAS